MMSDVIRLDAISLIIFDFDGVFTDNRVIVDETGKESVICHRSDGLGLDLIRRLNIPMAIVSTEKNPVVAHRAKKLRLPCYYGCEDKLAKVNELCAEFNTSLEHVAFVGNDSNDGACLAAVGFPVIVANAHPSVQKLAKLRLKRKGGDGAVREFCELVYRAHQGKKRRS